MWESEKRQCKQKQGSQKTTTKFIQDQWQNHDDNYLRKKKTKQHQVICRMANNILKQVQETVFQRYKHKWKKTYLVDDIPRHTTEKVNDKIRFQVPTDENLESKQNKNEDKSEVNGRKLYSKPRLYISIPKILQIRTILVPDRMQGLGQTFQYFQYK